MTKRQQEFMDTIERFWLEYKCPPTLGDLAFCFSISRGGVQWTVARLKLEGHLLNERAIIPSNIVIKFGKKEGE